MPSEHVTDPITGIHGPVAVRTVGAAGHEPIFILLGDKEATVDTSVGAYGADAAKLAQVFRNHLPSGTYARLVVDYLRDFRRDGAQRAVEPDTLNGDLLRVINAITETFRDSEPVDLARCNSENSA